MLCTEKMGQKLKHQQTKLSHTETNVVVVPAASSCLVNKIHARTKPVQEF